MSPDLELDRVRVLGNHKSGCLVIFKVSPPVVVVLSAEVIFCRKVSFESSAADSSGWAIVVRRGFCKILKLRATFHKS